MPVFDLFTQIIVLAAACRNQSLLHRKRVRIGGKFRHERNLLPVLHEHFALSVFVRNGNHSPVRHRNVNISLDGRDTVFSDNEFVLLHPVAYSGEQRKVVPVRRHSRIGEIFDDTVEFSFFAAVKRHVHLLRRARVKRRIDDKHPFGEIRSPYVVFQIDRADPIRSRQVYDVQNVPEFFAEHVRRRIILRPPRLDRRRLFVVRRVHIERVVPDRHRHFLFPFAARGVNARRAHRFHRMDIWFVIVVRAHRAQVERLERRFRFYPRIRAWDTDKLENGILFVRYHHIDAEIAVLRIRLGVFLRRVVQFKQHRNGGFLGENAFSAGKDIQLLGDHPAVYLVRFFARRTRSENGIIFHEQFVRIRRVCHDAGKDRFLSRSLSDEIERKVHARDRLPFALIVERVVFAHLSARHDDFAHAHLLRRVLPRLIADQTAEEGGNVHVCRAVRVERHIQRKRDHVRFKEFGVVQIVQIERIFYAEIVYPLHIVRHEQGRAFVKIDTEYARAEIVPNDDTHQFKEIVPDQSRNGVRVQSDVFSDHDGKGRVVSPYLFDEFFGDGDTDLFLLHVAFHGVQYPFVQSSVAERLFAEFRIAYYAQNAEPVVERNVHQSAEVHVREINFRQAERVQRDDLSDIIVHTLEVGVGYFVFIVRAEKFLDTVVLRLRFQLVVRGKLVEYANGDVVVFVVSRIDVVVEREVIIAFTKTRNDRFPFKRRFFGRNFQIIVLRGNVFRFRDLRYLRVVRVVGVDEILGTVLHQPVDFERRVPQDRVLHIEPDLFQIQRAERHSDEFAEFKSEIKIGNGVERRTDALRQTAHLVVQHTEQYPQIVRNGYALALFADKRIREVVFTQSAQINGVFFERILHKIAVHDIPDIHDVEQHGKRVENKERAEIAYIIMFVPYRNIQIIGIIIQIQSVDMGVVVENFNKISAVTTVFFVNTLEFHREVLYPRVQFRRRGNVVLAERAHLLLSADQSGVYFSKILRLLQFRPPIVRILDGRFLFARIGSLPLPRARRQSEDRRRQYEQYRNK